jgi:hypothetical protein
MSGNGGVATAVGGGGGGGGGVGDGGEGRGGVASEGSDGDRSHHRGEELGARVVSPGYPTTDASGAHNPNSFGAKTHGMNTGRSADSSIRKCLAQGGVGALHPGLVMFGHVGQCSLNISHLNISHLNIGRLCSAARIH